MTGAVLDFSRNGLVTRSGSLTFEMPTDPAPTFPPSSHEDQLRAVRVKRAQEVRRAAMAEAPFFVDWLTISQTHADPVPTVDSGHVWAASEDGEIEWTTSRARRHVGSFETSVAVKSDGHRVTLSGNLSRYGRRDNLFGFDLLSCLERANEILSEYGLPPFSPGVRSQIIPRTEAQSVWSWTGARISRIDLTANFTTGSESGAHALMQYLGSQRQNRQEGRVLGQGETVAWGGVGKGARQYWKAYIKHLEMMRHDGADSDVIEWCRQEGIVRFEGTLRTKVLGDLGASWVGEWLEGDAMGRVVQVWNEKAAIFDRVTRTTDELSDLPRAARGVARDYLAGMDLGSTMSRASFYRYRAKLLPYGIDIAVRNVRPFAPRVEVVSVRPASRPSWYSMERAA